MSDNDSSAEQLKKATTANAKPLNLDALVASGVLVKFGAWYQIVEPTEVPKHVIASILDTKTGKGGVSLVRFTPP